MMNSVADAIYQQLFQAQIHSWVSLKYIKWKVVTEQITEG